ncbi:MAG: recombination mediator RecR [Myxococcota bacterium]|nr:recombination mediator RecR [Myxococcota bacterium]
MNRDPLSELVKQLSSLPGIGEKTASRLAYHIARSPRDYAEALSRALLEVKDKVTHCELCADLTESSPCARCLDPRRERQLLCVVESPQDIRAIEATGEFRGLYHVLHGALSPLDGVGPEQLKIVELLRRLDEVEEVVLATNPSVEGESTALYLRKLISPLGVKLSRIASGLPMGSQVEYADKVTLGRALADRRQY